MQIDLFQRMRTSTTRPAIPPRRQDTVVRSRRRQAIRLGVPTLVVALAGHAHAAGVTAEAGPSWTTGYRSTGAVFVSVLGEEHSVGPLQWQFEFDVGAIASRGTTTAALDHAVGVAAAGARVPHLWRNTFFSFQVAAAAPHTDALSSTQQFVSTVGWQAKYLVVMVRHISNGSTHEPNGGESMLLVGVRL